jgi:hypothetical protein
MRESVLTAEMRRTQRTWILDLRREFRKSKCFAFAGGEGISSLPESNLFPQSALADRGKSVTLRSLRLCDEVGGGLISEGNDGETPRNGKSGL